jgi:hypothetical protein
VYFGREEKFLSHSGVYQLRMLNWPLSENSKSEVILDVQKEMPQASDEFGGLYGYQNTYTNCGFLDNSSRFYVIQSQMLGDNKVFVVDVQEKKVKMINLFNAPAETRMHNSLTLIKTFKQNVFVKYDSTTNPGGIYMVSFKSIEVDNLDALFSNQGNMDV